jgi:hypothetical protein
MRSTFSSAVNAERSSAGFAMALSLDRRQTFAKLGRAQAPTRAKKSSPRRPVPVRANAWDRSSQVGLRHRASFNERGLSPANALLASQDGLALSTWIRNEDVRRHRTAITVWLRSTGEVLCFQTDAKHIASLPYCGRIEEACAIQSN